ncbi:MAG TPA: iron-sulfur cluster repair di-iron protein [Pirellulales bacterium]|nr:iron-sulfur cluster repair di-iron protein [Pirellulales bacterium]
MDTLEIPTTQTTVGELVARRPSRSRVFEKLGIDYCCGGKLPLSEACAAKGIDADTVLAILLAAEEGTKSQEDDWTGATLADLANHIEQTHHAYLKRELPRLGAIVHKVATVHGAHYPWLLELEGIYTRFAAEMEAHMMKEDRMLFPRIRGLESGEPGPMPFTGPGVANPIRIMEHEHDSAGQSLARMRELSSEFTPPPDACNTFCAMLDGLRELEADTHRHVHKENSILFPRAIELERHAALNAD